VREASGLNKLLRSEEFIFFLNFFYDIMKHVDILYNTIQKQNSTSITIENAFQNFESAVSEIRTNTDRYHCHVGLYASDNTLLPQENDLNKKTT
jgi:hypothetical protein